MRIYYLLLFFLISHIAFSQKIYVNAYADSDERTIIINYTFTSLNPYKAYDVEILYSLNEKSEEYFKIPIENLRGDVGANITGNGSKIVLWDITNEPLLSKNKDELSLTFKVRAIPSSKKDYTISDINMVFVKGGTFKMGNNNGVSSERPEHTVTLSDFYIGRYEVTIGEYLKFVQASGKHQPEWLLEDSKYHIKKGSDDHYSSKGVNERQLALPIVGISWFDAVAYCDWLSLQTGEKYRLPTEAEWEFAARGGNKSQNHRFSGGSNIDEVGWYKGNSNGKLKAVGLLKANELGIYDMSGNAQEWCSDWYDKNYYAQSPISNPKGAQAGQNKVIRGGSFNIDAGYIYPTDRSFSSPENQKVFYGFRLCKSH